MQKFILRLLPFIIIGCWSCSSRGEEEIIPTPQPEQVKIEISSAEPVLSPKGETATLSFTTNTSWTANVSDNTPWVTISPTNGNKGNNTLTIKTIENDTYDQRNATITIKAGVITKNITVTQKQKDALILTSNKVELTSEESDFSIEVQTNSTLSYEIEENAKEWIKPSENRGLSNKTLKFTALANDSIVSRQASITLKGGDNLKETLMVYQEGEAATLLLTQKEYTIKNEGETITVELKSNVNYEMQMPDVNWVSEANGRAISSHTHYFTISPNEKTDERKTQIVFLSKTDNLSDTLTIRQKGRTAYPTPKEDRAALYILFQAMNGNTWNNNTNWCTDKPLNEWYGVSTDSEGRVTRIDLGGNNLSGYLPEAISALTELRSLYLWSNNINGPLPESIGNLTKLENLYTSGNPITGEIPSSIGNLQCLRSLYMESCQLEGELPESFYELKKLNNLWLSNNKLEGVLSSKICQMKELGCLGLRENNFTGLPASIQELTNLYWLELGGNPFSGSFPKELCKLTNLKHLYLYGCQLNGLIPSDIGNLSKLISLKLDGNNLIGDIPSSIGNLTQLQELGLCNNNLSGKIPEEFTNLRNLYRATLYNNPQINELPTSIKQLPCWEYMWWNFIKDTSIDNPIEKKQVPGPSFKVVDLKGDSIISVNEYKKNSMTILIQWDPQDNSSQNFIPTLSALYKKYYNKKLRVIGWCSNWQLSEEQLKEYIAEQKIEWINFKSTYENGFTKNCRDFPADTNGWLTVSAIDQNNNLRYSSVLTSLDEFPDFLANFYGE